ncbi:ATP-binding SpoIIE family protein phosphatase [Streptomyces sp. NPDC001219]
MYQMHNLARDLSAAQRLPDVMRIAESRTMKPISADGMAVGTWEGAHMRLLGCAGYPPSIAREVIRDSTALRDRLPLFVESGSGMSSADLGSLSSGKQACMIAPIEQHGGKMAGVLYLAVRAYAAEGHRPSDVLQRTNGLLLELGTDLLATCCCVWVDLAMGTAEVCTAGHPPPLLHSENGVEALEGPHGLPLGVQAGTFYQSREFNLPQNSVLALYTDGLVRSHEVDEESGTRRLYEVFSGFGGRHLEDLASRLIEITDGDTRDDVAFLLIRLQGWGWEEICPEAELLASELVTNARVHADRDVDVRIRLTPDRARIEVKDSDPRLPGRRP